MVFQHVFSHIALLKGKKMSHSLNATADAIAFFFVMFYAFSRLFVQIRNEKLTIVALIQFSALNSKSIQ